MPGQVLLLGGLSAGHPRTPQNPLGLHPRWVGPAADANQWLADLCAQGENVQDVLLRRTSIGQSRCQGRDCALSIGARMAELCGWSARRLDAELDAYRQHLHRSHRFRVAGG